MVVANLLTVVVKAERRFFCWALRLATVSGKAADFDGAKALPLSDEDEAALSVELPFPVTGLALAGLDLWLGMLGAVEMLLSLAGLEQCRNVVTAPARRTKM